VENKIKVSVIVSVYNQENYVEQCLRSIMEQTFSDIEIIVIDNGCTDNSVNIIEKLAKEDSRIVVLHNPQGSTYGNALKLGIQKASGEYVGIVESDDWIAPYMYEKLYNKITEFSADVALTSFTRHLPENKQVNEELITKFSSDKKLFSIDDYPDLLYLHPSIWAKLYKKSFLQTITIYEDEKYFDQPFLIELFSKTNKIISVKDYLYHYRQDNINASSSIKKSDLSLIKIINAYKIARDIAKSSGLYEKYYEELYWHSAYVIHGWFHRISKKYKKQYFKEARKYFLEIENIKDFQYKYFIPTIKTFVQNVLKNNYRACFWDKYSSFKLGGVTIWEKGQKGESKLLRFLGMPLYYKKFQNNLWVSKTLFGAYKTKKNSQINKGYLMGIKCFSKKYKPQPKIPNDIEITRIIQRQMMISDTHTKVFPQFKNMYVGKKIVIVGAGPTLKYYQPIKDAIHMGVNKTFLAQNVELDYLFLLDYFSAKEYIDQASSYRGEKCKKFYGMLQEQNHPMFIPDSKCLQPFIYRYWVADSNYNMHEQFNYYLNTQPLPCFFSVIFQAISFALWTNPSEIYLVGCDANFNGHFDGSPMASQNSHWEYLHKTRNYDGWNKLKTFAKTYYPETRIISINPVGLKNYFEDEYTQTYLQAQEGEKDEIQ